jgi:hypothetical protein
MQARHLRVTQKRDTTVAGVLFLLLVRLSQLNKKPLLTKITILMEE